MSKYNRKYNEFNVKRSFGFIFINPNVKPYDILLVKHRFSYEFYEFVVGKKSNKIDMIKHLINGMRETERDLLKTLNFELIWKYIWGNDAKTTSQFYKYRYKIFKKRWLCDGGFSLKKLILIAKPYSHKPRLCLPKGRKQSLMETDINCAIRETQEELGIIKSDYNIIPNCKHVVKYDRLGITYIITYFVAIPNKNFDISKCIKSDKEISEFGWYNIEKLNEICKNKFQIKSLVDKTDIFIQKYLKTVKKS